MPLRAWIGLAFILSAFAFYGGRKWWMATRTWVPLDIPISLVPGHIRSPIFEINLGGWFEIYVEVERKFDYDGVPCWLGYRFASCDKTSHDLRASWTLHDSGRPLSRGASESYQGSFGGMVTVGRYLGSFNAEPGELYSLDLTVLDDSSYLNAGHPRLRIRQVGYSWKYESEEEMLFALATLFVAIGIALLLRTAVVLAHEKREREKVSLTAVGPLSKGFAVGAQSSSAEPHPDSTTSHFSGSFCLSLGLLVLGLSTFTAVQAWMSTRTFVPVDIPVSLAAGHITTGPFEINLATDYAIRLEFDQKVQFDPNCTSYSQLQTQWVLYRAGRETSRWDTSVLHDGDLAGFSSAKGMYNLDVNVLSDASCLNRYRPRLRVFTWRSDYETYAVPVLWGAALCVVTGAALLWFNRDRRRSFRAERETQVAPTPSIGQNCQWARTLPLRRPISGLPNFGMIAAIVFAILAMMMMLLGPVTPKGLWVHLLKPGEVPAKSDKWTEPLIVRLQDAGPGKEPKVFVNSEHVTWDDLPAALKRQLSLRRDWTVYVQGDEGIAYGNVANVVDAARTLDAKVFLLTSNSPAQ